MHPHQQLQLYETVSDALGRTAGESLLDTAERCMREGRAVYVAMCILRPTAGTPDAAWANLREAADVWRAGLN